MIFVKGWPFARHAEPPKLPARQVEAPAPVRDRRDGPRPRRPAPGPTGDGREHDQHDRPGRTMSNAPLSSATFITQHIAQERMTDETGETADPRRGTESYDRRADTPPRRSDLLRRV